MSFNIERVINANALSFPLALSVSMLDLQTGEVHNRTVVARTLMEVVDISPGSKITCNCVVRSLIGEWKVFLLVDLGGMGSFMLHFEGRNNALSQRRVAG